VLSTSTAPSSLKHASLKHAINNPLAIISGNAQLLQDIIRKKECRSELAKPLQDIEEACQRIAALLEGLDAPAARAAIRWENEPGYGLALFAAHIRS